MTKENYKIRRFGKHSAFVSVYLNEKLFKYKPTVFIPREARQELNALKSSTSHCYFLTFARPGGWGVDEAPWGFSEME